MNMDSKYILKSKDLVIVPSDDNNLWNGDWIVGLKSGEQIGKASFAGKKEYGAIPINVELDEQYRNTGYGTRVFRMMVNFAFKINGIYEVTARTDRENDKCVKALEKARFIHRGTDNGVELYSKIKDKTAWTGIYLLIGIIVGMILGIVIGNLPVGMGIGVVACTLIGINMDLRENKIREQVRGNR